MDKAQELRCILNSRITVLKHELWGAVEELGNDDEAVDRLSYAIGELEDLRKAYDKSEDLLAPINDPVDERLRFIIAELEDLRKISADLP